MSEVRGRRLRVALVGTAVLSVLVVGQAGRELLPYDDLREAQVAHEMYDGGDLVIPHLASVPFLEKDANELLLTRIGD